MVDTVSEIFDGAHFVIVSSEQYLQENNTSHEQFCTSEIVSYVIYEKRGLVVQLMPQLLAKHFSSSLDKSTSKSKFCCRVLLLLRPLLVGNVFLVTRSHVVEKAGHYYALRMLSTITTVYPSFLSLI